MFRIKICGVTNVEDAVQAVDAGADAVGLNFYAKSSRFVDVAIARDIARMAYERVITPVGVFVNQSPDEVHRLAAAAEISVFQLHGDESPEVTKEILEDEWEVIRVHRYKPAEGLAALQQDLEHYYSVVGCCPDYLLDSGSKDKYGGTGLPLPWEELRTWDQLMPSGLSLILAGGLTPDNVAEAIRIVRPAAVDVASGVESVPGKKDPIKVRDFIQAARAAFGE